MRKNDSLLYICLVTYLLCVLTMFVLGYKDLSLMLLILIIVVVLILHLLNDTKVQYKLLSKKAIIYTDIVNSKLIKLYYGNEKKLINDIYTIIINNVENGFVKKIGFSHFIILIEYKNKQQIISLINRINSEIKKITNDEIFVILIKYGIMICNKDNYDINVNKAALACNNARLLSLSSYCFYEDNESLTRINEEKLLYDLINSLKNKEFEVYYQPKYNYKTNKIVGSEALIRLVKNGKVIPASKFINVAEKYGFTVLIDKFVLNEVCKKIVELKEKNIDFNTISINVSRNTLCEDSILDYYLQTINKYGIKKSEIELEVTERDSLNNMYNLEKNIHELCKKFNVSVDDFGIGNSSLSMLNEKGVKTIKIDREFIKDNSVSGRKILSNIIKLIKDLGLEIIAEGVESEEEYTFLKKKGCNVIQGYYYSKPLSFDDYLKLLLGED